MTSASSSTQELDTSLNELDDFLASVQRRAYRMALLATRQPADAMDIVQDAMMKLAQKYSTRPPLEWSPLFQRILQNRIMDWHRQQAKNRRWLRFLQSDWQADDQAAEQESVNESMDQLFDQMMQQPLQDPARLLAKSQSLDTVLVAVENLSLRQQQAFLLRAWEGFDVTTTASTMGCSEGSVKAHYFRAVHHLRDALGDESL